MPGTEAEPREVSIALAVVNLLNAVELPVLDRVAARAAGARPFLLGLLLWVIVSFVTFASIRRGWIH